MGKPYGFALSTEISRVVETIPGCRCCRRLREGGRFGQSKHELRIRRRLHVTPPYAPSAPVLPTKPEAEALLPKAREEEQEARNEWYACLASHEPDCSGWALLLQVRINDVAELEGIVKDPPDANYQRLTAAAADTSPAYLDALRISLERYRGAQAAGDAESMAPQLTAMRLYEKRMADSLRRRANEAQTRAQSLPPDNAQDLMTRQAELEKNWPNKSHGDVISRDQRQKLLAVGFTEAQLNDILQQLRALKQPPKLKGSRATLLDLVNTDKESADQWQRASDSPVNTGAGGQRDSPLFQTYAIANPHDRQETVDLFIRPVSIPPDWKLSIVNAEQVEASDQTAKPGGTQPKYPVHEIDPGKHYNITLPAKAETKVASVVIPVGEIGARTTARWAVEGKIGNELIGGMVHEMNVPYIIADLQLPPVGSKEVEEELPTPSRPWARVAAEVAVAIVILGLLTFFFIFWRRRRRTTTGA